MQMKRCSTVIVACLALAACSQERGSFLDPGGPIASAQRAHLITLVSWTMIAIIPVFVLVPLLLWRYRYRNTSARYTPDWHFSGWLDVLMWGVPILIITVLSVNLWTSTHALDPYKPIASDAPPLRVQVVGLDWKWLFIYPDLGIATVNQLAFPAGASVAMDLTTDTVMQSFMVPALAGQIYAMPGMRTKLHLLASAPGRFSGENTQWSGIGFVEQKFQALAMDRRDFDAWVAQVRNDGVTLDTGSYGRLAVPGNGAAAQAAIGSAAMPEGVTWFASVTPQLFETILGRYTQSKALAPAEQPGAVGYVPPPMATGPAPAPQQGEGQ